MGIAGLQPGACRGIVDARQAHIVIGSTDPVIGIAPNDAAALYGHPAVIDTPRNEASFGQHARLPVRVTVADELQATIVELVDLTLLVQQLSWSATGRDTGTVRRTLEELLVRLRVHIGEVAARMLELGHLPSGQSRTVAIETDLTPLPPGRLDADGALAALSERIEQVQTRLVLARRTTATDAITTELLADIHGDLTVAQT